MTQQRVILVALSGCSSSGKTLTQKVFPSSILIHEDDFYKHDDQIPINDKYKIADWDCPEALDLDMFKKELDHIKTTGDIATKLIHNDNVDDLSKFKIDPMLVSKLADTYAANFPVDKFKVVFVDGFMMFHDREIVDKFDVKLFFRAPYATLKKRREQRNGYQTLDSYWVDPPYYFDEFVYRAYSENHAYLFENNDVESRMRSMSLGIADFVNDDNVDVSEGLEWICKMVTSGVY